MKLQFLYILAVALLFILPVSCADRVDERLRKVESLMETHPDSALTLLASIDSISLSSVKDRHIRNILEAEARYKCFYDDTADIRIAHAVEYFRNDFESKYRMKAYFYHGIVRKNRKDYGSSIISLKESERSARKIEDTLWLGRIHSTLGDVFCNIRNTETAISYYRKALSEFKRHGENPYIGDALYDVCRSYNNQGMSDSCLAFIPETLHYAREFSDSTLMCNTLSVAAESYLAKGEYDKVISAFDSIEVIDKSYMDDNDFGTLGIAFLRMNDLGNAVKCEKEINKRDSANCNLSWQIAEKKEDYKRAFQKHRAFSERNNSIYSEWLTRGQEKAILENYDLLEKNMNLEIETNRLWIMFLGSLCLLLGLLFIFALKWRSNIKKENSRLMQTLIGLKDEFSSASSLADKKIAKISAELIEHKNLAANREKAVVEARKIIEESLKSEFSILDKLASEYYSLGDSEFDKQRIFNKVKKILSSIRKDKNTRKKLESIVNARLNNLIVHIAEDYPTLSEDDISLFVYIVLDFSGKAIAFFMGISDDAVYSRKRSLKIRLEKGGAEISSRYLKYF